MCPLKDIVKWNKERQLTDFSGPREYALLLEELQEFYSAYSEDSEQEAVDALCDIIVVAVGGLHKLGYDPKAALAETVKEISSRVGSVNNETGKWKKDPNQDPSTLYKADYSAAKV